MIESYAFVESDMQLKRVAEAKLPTPWGDFLMVGFEELATGHDHLALVFGDISGEAPVLARVHSECLTGDAAVRPTAAAVLNRSRACRLPKKAAGAIQEGRRP